MLKGFRQNFIGLWLTIGGIGFGALISNRDMFETNFLLAFFGTLYVTFFGIGFIVWIINIIHLAWIGKLE